MKRLFPLLALLLVGCEPAGPEVKPGSRDIALGSGLPALHIQVVVLDGKEYYLTHVGVDMHSYALCPKLPLTP